MADPQLVSGNARLQAALINTPTTSKLGLMRSNRYSKWKLADGNLSGWITTALSGRTEADVGFLMSQSGGAVVAAWAIDISVIDPTSFT